MYYKLEIFTGEKQMLPHITYMYFYVAEHTFHTNSTSTITHHHPSTLLMNEIWCLFPHLQNDSILWLIIVT
jgi:hypothetical protein